MSNLNSNAEDAVTKWENKYRAEYKIIKICISLEFPRQLGINKWPFLRNM